MAAIVWKGFISFGLVSFPVRLYTAARPESVHFHMLHRKDLARVKEVWYCSKEDKPIDRTDIVKGYEVSKGEYVVVDDEELKALAPPTATAMEVLQFVKDDEVDPIFFERSYYVAPDETISKPYVLFMEALRASKRSAIAKLSMHGRENIVLIRPAEDGMILHALYYPDELHAANKQTIPAKSAASRKELDLAKSLIQHLSGPFHPEKLHDEYRENVEKLIEQKRKGQKITPIRQTKPAPVTDLMAALQQSLKATTRGETKSKASARKTAKSRKAA